MSGKVQASIVHAPPTCQYFHTPLTGAGEFGTGLNLLG